MGRNARLPPGRGRPTCAITAVEMLRRCPRYRGAAHYFAEFVASGRASLATWGPQCVQPRSCRSGSFLLHRAPARFCLYLFHQLLGREGRLAYVEATLPLTCVSTSC